MKLALFRILPDRKGSEQKSLESPRTNKSIVKSILLKGVKITSTKVVTEVDGAFDLLLPTFGLVTLQPTCKHTERF